MDQNILLAIIFVGIPAAMLIYFFIWKNKKDQKTLNPDADDIIEETHHDQHRNDDKS